MKTNLPVELLKGIGPKRGQVLREEADVHTIEDLIYFKPRRYLDRSTMAKIVDCFLSQQVTVAGQVVDVSMSGHGRRFLAVTIDDGSGELSGVFFGGTQYYSKLFEVGDHVLFSGKIDIFNKRLQIVHPEYDFFDEDPTKSVHTGRIIPLYRSSDKLKKAGFTSRVFRSLIHSAIEEHIAKLDDPLPISLINKYNYPSLADALRAIHFPVTFEELSRARTRLAFNELFFLQYYLALSKRYQRLHDTKPHRIKNKSLFEQCRASLPFTLTNDQSKAIDEITVDLENPYSMNRLLQGDVGSGKTVVALLACALVISDNKQCAVMAPTEVLAKQHYATFTKLASSHIRIALLTGSTKSKEKKESYNLISEGKIDIVIGTHALIEDIVSFKNLGLVIIDEQHRFGVSQRAALHQKGESPDLLVMTATPIPRSLTLTLYGDLDVSSIHEKPSNRLPIKTLILPESRAEGLYKSIEKYISEGRQCFYVLPLIHESEKMDLESAVTIYDSFKSTIFKNRKVGLLHGKLKSAEKDDIMKQFSDGEIDILVSTTVIEVGIDVPNASVMVIHHPERFGLSQLHQLRGRVGRGQYQSFCVLFHPDKISDDAKHRLAILEINDDGFAISEEDLKIRGAGDFLGNRQHGDSAEFEFADFALDYSLIIQAREDALKYSQTINDIDAEINKIKTTYASADYLTGTRLSKILSLIS
jgi:ATP-dependent DNA helicase RecG